MDASFQMLVDMCNEVGWDLGLYQLEKIVLRNENLQADLYAGTPTQVDQALKLSETIIQQNTSIGRLKRYRADHGL